MFEFLVGYVFGASKSDSGAVSAKSVAIFVLAVVAIAGFGWLVVSRMSVGQMTQCGGTAMVAAMCNLEASAEKIGLILLGLTLSIAVIWITASHLLKK